MPKRGRIKPYNPKGKGATEAKAEWILMRIRDDARLDGKHSRLMTITRDHFKCAKRQAEEAITRAYELLDEERKRQLPGVVAYIDRGYRRAIDLAIAAGDARNLVIALDSYSKLLGAGEPDRVSLEGGATATGITVHDVALLGALKLTNPQRAAEIEALEKEIAERTTAAMPKPKSDPIAKDRAMVAAAIAQQPVVVEPVSDADFEQELDDA